jgi:hypothetical protein
LADACAHNRRGKQIALFNAQPKPVISARPVAGQRHAKPLEATAVVSVRAAANHSRFPTAIGAALKKARARVTGTPAR